MTLDGLDLAKWKPLAGDSLPSGSVTALLKLVADQDAGRVLVALGETGIAASHRRVAASRDVAKERPGRMLAAVPTVIVVIAEAVSFPELGRAFYELGPGRTITQLTKAIQRLTERGLVTTTRGSDRRVKLLALTTPGRKLRAGLQQHVADASPAMTRLTQTERQTLMLLLDKLHDRTETPAVNPTT